MTVLLDILDIMAALMAATTMIQIQKVAVAVALPTSGKAEPLSLIAW